MPAPSAVRVFLDAPHLLFAERVAEFAASEIVPRREPADDAAARIEARQLLLLLGAGGWFQPIFNLDLRACCLAREVLGGASPLADAVFALQALGATPILLGGSPAQRDRWLGPIAKGTVMTA